MKAQNCINMIMQVRQIGEIEATKLFNILLNTPQFRVAVITDDNWTIGETLFHYSLKYDPQWKWYRDKQKLEERLIKEEIDRLRKEYPQNQYESDSDLRHIAIKNLVARKEKFERLIAKELINEC